jgi:hypothetical protein
MANKTSGVNKSEEIRQLLKANPDMKAKEVVSTLAGKGIKITDALVYFIKGKLHGKKKRKQKAAAMVAKVAETTSTPDPLAAILKIKRLASELGGMKKLRALVEALSD